jgi:16S rRNA processing protein RimM
MAAQICIARIGAAHGVRGAVKLLTFTEDPLAVQRYGPLATKDGARQFEVTHAREAKDHLVATLKGIATREEAERLNGAGHRRKRVLPCRPDRARRGRYRE